MRKYIAIILVLIGYSSFGQTYLVQPAKWRFTNSQRFDSTVRFYNLPILTGDTVLGFNPYSKKIGLKIISSTSYSAGNGLLLGGTTFYADTTKLVSTHGNQNIYGNKSFWGDIINYGNYNNYAIAGHVLTGTGGFMWNGHDEKITSGATTARTWRMPDSTGTVALLSNIPTNYWSTSGNTFSNGQYLGTNNNRGFGIRTNGVQREYIDSIGRHGFGYIPTSNAAKIQVNGSILAFDNSTIGGITIGSGGGTNFQNVGIGSSALVGNTSGTSNVGVGYLAAPSITTGQYNTSIGASSLPDLSTGSNNISLGQNSGLTVQTGSYNILIGNNSKTPATSTSNFMNIARMIYGTGVNGTGIGLNGKIGIRTATPLFGLDINTTVALNKDSLPSGASTDSVVMIRTSTNQLTKRAASSFGSSYTAGRGLTLNSSVFRLDTALISNLAYISANSTTTAKSVYQMGATVPVHFKSSDGNTLLYLDETNERVGFGTNAPTKSLDIRSDFRFGSGSGDGTVFVNGAGYVININGTDRIRYAYSGSNVYIQNAASTALYFSGNSGSDMTDVGFKTSGNFTVGSLSSISKFAVPIAPTASANYGLVSLGSGAFDGSTPGFFTGSASGTVLAVNAASGYAGDLVNAQVAGASKFKVSSTGLVTGVGGANFGGLTVNGSGTLNNPGGIEWHATGYFINYNNNFGYNFLNYGGSNASSGSYYGFGITNQTIAQTGTAGWTDLLVNRVQTSVGSGAQNLMDLQVGSSSKFKVDNVGNTTAAKYYVSALNTAPSSASDTGTAGEIRFASDGYLYLATATNTWIRVQLNTW